MLMAFNELNIVSKLDPNRQIGQVVNFFVNISKMVNDSLNLRRSLHFIYNWATVPSNVVEPTVSKVALVVSKKLPVYIY